MEMRPKLLVFVPPPPRIFELVGCRSNEVDVTKKNSLRKSIHEFISETLKKDEILGVCVMLTTAYTLTGVILS